MSRTRASARRAAGVGMRALVALVVGTVVLTGCQSNPKPPPLDSAPESPSPSESPTAAAPALPPEAKGTSEAAAKAFVRHYVALISHAMATGDTAPLKMLSSSDCTSCKAVVETIDDVYGNGGRIVSKGWQVRSIQAVPSQPRERPKFDLGLLMSPQRVEKTASAKPTFFKGGRLPATFSLARRADGWQVLDWERAA